MRKLLIGLAALMLCFTSCSKDDDGPTPNVTATDIVGVWNTVTVKNGLQVPSQYVEQVKNAITSKFKENVVIQFNEGNKVIMGNQERDYSVANHKVSISGLLVGEGNLSFDGYLDGDNLDLVLSQDECRKLIKDYLTTTTEISEENANIAIKTINGSITLSLKKQTEKE